MIVCRLPPTVSSLTTTHGDSPPVDRISSTKNTNDFLNTPHAVQFPVVAAGAALIAAGALAATGTITPVGVAVGGGAAVAAAGGGMMVAEEMCLGNDE